MITSLLNKFTKKKPLEPHFIFMLTPPYSGSTAIAKFLDTSEYIGLLQEKAEGQWLLPEISGKGRWNANLEVDYSKIKKRWLNRYKKIKSTSPKVSYIVEKSPPNMVRQLELAQQFKHYSFIANNRHPYGYCVSSLYHHNDADNLDSKQRTEKLLNHAKVWVERSKMIRDFAIQHQVPLVTYEDFCDDPFLIVEKLQLPKKVVRSINAEQKLCVKDYKPQKIVNQNDRQIAKLSESEISQLRNFLGKESNLLEWFGYQI